MLRGLGTIRAGLIVHGAQTTSNIVVEEGIDGYDGIMDMGPSARPDSDILTKLDELETSFEACTSDPIDTLVVAITTMLSKDRGESTPAWHHILYIFVRAGLAVESDDIDAISARMRHAHIDLRVVNLDDDYKMGAPWTRLAPSTFMSLGEALRDAASPAVQLSKSMPSRTWLTFGEGPDQLAIPVCILKATALQRPPAPIRATPNGDPVEIRHRYYRHSEAFSEEAQALPQEVESTFQRAYRLGASLVPAHDVPSPTIETSMGLEIMHFVHAATLCILAPDAETDSFTMAQVPFSSDIQRTTFPPLDRVPTRDGMEQRVHATIPTEEQQHAMDVFVDMLQSPIHLPDTQPNPAIHELKHFVKVRIAMVPDIEIEQSETPGRNGFVAARYTRTKCYTLYRDRKPKRRRSDNSDGGDEYYGRYTKIDPSRMNNVRASTPGPSRIESSPEI
ncbi:ATP-dependent DNA helicase yku80 [Malassezia cuniculi]|uniref:ATP-dependent DNA helicase yku80 n=1 Tax=Malassezia cuniculi TaxID=948313 RepID=A0AAF0EZG0_9BASI|nr:ATP-dependent DNA helicase yku80 [Malassezia cuniculi]